MGFELRFLWHQIEPLYNAKGFLPLLLWTHITQQLLNHFCPLKELRVDWQNMGQWLPQEGDYSPQWTVPSSPGKRLDVESDNWEFSATDHPPVPGSVTKSMARGPCVLSLLLGCWHPPRGWPTLSLLAPASCASCWPKWKALHFMRMK